MGITLPRWVWIGAGCLAAVAGMVNAVGFLGYAHQAVTHMTGASTVFGIAVAQGQWAMALELAALVLSFVAGAIASGLIVQDSVLRLGSRYGVALAVEAALLAAAVPLFEHGHVAGALLAAAACGLQNAMATTYSGALVRTTHLTGLLTDLGVAFGHRLRGLPVGPRRMRLCLLVVACFIAGGVAGTVLFEAIAYKALYLPAALVGGVGLAYAVYSHGVSRRRME